VSVTNCYRSYKLFRMLPLVSSHELKSAISFRLSCVGFAGYQFDGGSRSRQQLWHASVNMELLCNVCNCTVSRRQRALAVVTCMLHRQDSWSFPERGRNMATEALPSTDFVSGTVCLLRCELQTYHELYSKTNWKLMCSISRNWFSTFAAPFHSCIATSKLELYKYQITNNNKLLSLTYEVLTASQVSW